MALTGRHDYENMLCWLPEIDTNKYGIPEIHGIKELPEDPYFTTSEFILLSLLNLLCIFLIKMLEKVQFLLKMHFFEHSCTKLCTLLFI